MAKNINKYPVIVFDVDGVLNDIRDGQMQDFVRPEYFAQRPARREMLLVVLLLWCTGVDVRFITAVYNQSIIEAKRKWLAASGVGDIPVAYPLCGTPKMLAFPDLQGRHPLLVDDHTPNLFQWEQDGGVGVKFLNGHNGRGGRWQGPKIACNMPADDLAMHLRRLAERG